MKKFIIVLLLLASIPLMAERVDPETARKVATTFLNNNGAKSVQLTDLSKEAGFSNLYIFNGDLGFVVMAADDCVKPILGYSLTGTFKVDGMPENIKSWLQGYSNQIQEAIDDGQKAATEASVLWNDLVAGNNKAGITTAVVDSLIMTKWGQSPYFNNLCPTNTSGTHAVTGCVATAMAQIIYYWSQTATPPIGIGSHTYTHVTFGKQTADFAGTTYDWDNMTPTYGSSSTSAQIEAVATLMYHCGIAVDMDYGISSSGAFSSDIPVALMSYFNFSSSTKNVERYESSADWIDTLKKELDAGRPMEYSGSGSGGHSFICDGYDSNDNFHFNWGWRGSNNGYFTLDNLKPGSHNYTQSQKATIGIKVASCSIDAPSSFNATLIEGTKNVNLTWDAETGATEYYLFRNGTCIYHINQGEETNFSYIDKKIPFGENVYFLRSVDSHGELSLPSTYNTISLFFPAPSNLEASLSSSGTVNLSWDAVANADSYNVYCNDVLIANVITNSYEDSNPISGSLSYYVRGVSFGDESNSSTAATVSVPYKTPTVNDLDVTLSDNGASLSWSAAEWQYPSSFVTLTHYNNANIHYFLNPTFYGHRYLATDLAGHANKLIYKISTHISYTGTYTVYIYTNTTAEGKPDVLRDTRVLSCLDSGGWKEVPLSSPILITGEEDLWIVIKVEDTQSSICVPTCDLSTYNANACYCGDGSDPTDISPFIDSYRLCFLIKAFLSYGISYDIYDGNTKLNDETVLGTTYTHPNPSSNTLHQFKVKTIYSTSGGSDSNKISFALGNASVSSLSIGTNDRLTVTKGSTLTVSGTLTNTNPYNLILEDGSQLFNSSYNVKGTVKKTIKGFGTSDNKGGWYLIASPITESLSIAESTNLLNTNANYYDLYIFDQSDVSEWQNYKQNHFTTIENKKGYLYANQEDVDITFAGTLNYSDYMGYIYLTKVEGYHFSGYNLVGNPYPCNTTIDKDDFFRIVETNEGSKLLLATNPTIAPMEGIIVKADANNERINFTRLTPAAKSGYSNSMITLDVTQDDGSVLDNARIRFDGDYNMEKMTFRGPGTQLYLPQNGKKYALLVSDQQTEIPVNFKARHDGGYTLNIDVVNLDLNYLHLIDHLTGMDIDLLQNPSYSFEAKTDDYAARFKLVFNTEANDDIYGEDFVEGKTVIIDMTGRVVATDRNAQLAPGVYIIRTVNANEIHSKKIIIK